MYRKIIFSSILSLLNIYYSYSQHHLLVDQIAIEITNQSREYAYTNKESAFYYGQTNTTNRSGWQGFNVMAKEFLEDYIFSYKDSTIDKNSTRKSIVFPYQIKREYSCGIKETFTLLDHLPVLIINIELPEKSKFSFIPLVNDFKRADDFVVKFVSNALFIARKNHLVRNEKQNYPVYLGIMATVPCKLKNELHFRNDYSPAHIEISDNKKFIKIAIAVGDDVQSTLSMLKESLKNSDKLIWQRKKRMNDLLLDTYFETSNYEFNQALMWTKISMDALIMNQITKGIFAGLPWFNNYWGRDSFISFPGAVLVTGKFDEAKELLMSFARFQETDTTNPNYGRIPNIVTTTHISYNTADATPRFVIATYEYYKYTGDKDFLKKIFPYIERSVEGTIKYHTDENYFLVHDDAETWMDAVGPEGPWTPRGNRANDVQALWYKQLFAASEIANTLGKAELARKYQQLYVILLENFKKYFVDTNQAFIFDHLNIDDTRDLRIRPNQIFCTSILEDRYRVNILKNIISELTFEYGVASLSHNDEDFHPYHQNMPFYVKDAAYHQGCVWTWLSGELISEICYFNNSNKAFVLTENLVHQILDRGAIGTVSELLDAYPRQPGDEPELSGTFSQAWSLAEFIRNFYQDYLGVRFDFTNSRIIEIFPQIPEKLGNIKARIKFGKESFLLEYDNINKLSFKITNVKINYPINFVIKLNHQEKIYKVNVNLKNRSNIVIRYDENLKFEYNKNVSIESFQIDSNVVSYKSVLDVPFTIPDLSKNFKVMQPPNYRLLKNSEIKIKNPSAINLIDVVDYVHDDTGCCGYRYPLNSNFVNGILDITGFKVDYDIANIYFDLTFRKLVNPGWHPEYGFQLTYVAIAIDKNGKNNFGKKEIGMNAKYFLESDEAFEKIIYLGGGFRIEDDKGKIIAQYIPSDEDVLNPLGDVSSAKISFCVPIEILGTPEENWRFVVLVGAQDDHGGAGIGDFRQVELKESEWTGGGKPNPELPNIYDLLKSF